MTRSTRVASIGEQWQYVDGVYVAAGRRYIDGGRVLLWLVFVFLIACGSGAPPQPREGRSLDISGFAVVSGGELRQLLDPQGKQGVFGHLFVKNVSKHEVVLSSVTAKEIDPNISLVGFLAETPDENAPDPIGTSCGPFPPVTRKTSEVPGRTLKPGETVWLMAAITSKDKNPGGVRSIVISYEANGAKFSQTSRYAISLIANPERETCVPFDAT